MVTTDTNDEFDVFKLNMILAAKFSKNCASTNIDPAVFVIMYFDYRTFKHFSYYFNMNAQDEFTGMTPLMASIYYGQEKITKLLLKYWGKVQLNWTAEDIYGRTASTLAADSNNKSLMKRMLKKTI